jgi:hypothetical protein
MKDQGKISELNTSSHCYQSSNTVGQAPEPFESQSDFQPSPEGRYPKFVRDMDERHNHKCTKMWTCTREERLQANKRYLKLLRSLAKTKNNGTLSSVNKLLGSDYVNFGLTSNQRMSRHSSYLKFLNSYNHSRVMAMDKFDKTSFGVFLIDYIPDKPYKVQEKFLRKLDGFYASFIPSINFDMFPDISSSPAFEEAESSTRYSPQSGLINEQCSKYCDSAVNSNLAQYLLLLPEILKRFSTLLLNQISTHFEVDMTWGMVVWLLLLLYVLYKIVTDMLHALTFFLGIFTGWQWEANSKCNDFKPGYYKSPKDLFLSSSHNHCSKYSPQAGVLNSDQGDDFKGTSPKQSPTSDKPAVTPGVSAHINSAQRIFARQAPIKQSRKDPNDGPLNGFGIGI